MTLVVRDCQKSVRKPDVVATTSLVPLLEKVSGNFKDSSTGYKLFSLVVKFLLTNVPTAMETGSDV